MIKKAYLFDLDGTLLDTAQDFQRILNLLRSDHQLAPLSYETVRPYAALGSKAMIQAAFDHITDETIKTQLQKQFLDIYDHNPVVATTYFPSVQETLQFLIKNNIPFGIVTNKHEQYTKKIIAQFPELQHSRCVICSDNVTHIKPHAESLFLAIQQLGYAVEDCVYIGDTLVDIETARNAGMACIAVTYGYGLLTSDILSQANDHIAELGKLLR